MKVIIIEDKLPDMKELIHLLQAYKDVEIVSQCGDVFAALKAIREHQPDAMFLDIMLPGHDGFTLLDYMEADEYRPHVVIVSGGPGDYAIRAFGEGVLDYLAKPVEEERLTKAIERIREQLSIPNKKALPYPDRKLDIIPCVYNRRIKFIRPEDVEFVCSNVVTGVQVVCQNEKYYTELTLKTLVEKTDLIRCHQQHLIELGAVSEFEKLENGLAQIHTHSKRIVPVSRHFRKAIESSLGL